MFSVRENWQFEVKEIPGGEYCLRPEPRKESPAPLRRKRDITVLDDWNINLVLPTGTELEVARRIAELLNEWIQDITCTARDSSPGQV